VGDLPNIHPRPTKTPHGIRFECLERFDPAPDVLGNYISNSSEDPRYENIAAESGHPMTSRERIRAAINHHESDQVPIDLAGYFASGMAAIAYAKLRKYLGLAEKPIRVYDPHQVLAVIDEDVIQRFGVDTLQAGRAFDQDESCWGDWVLPDGTPCKWLHCAMPQWRNGEWVLLSTTGKVVAHMPEGVLNFEPANYPFAEKDSLDIRDIRVAISEF
jgi:uroporphyrinogen decarboxylase